MDIIKLQPFNNGKLLEGLFTYQLHLIEWYSELGMLDKPPLDFGQRKHKSFIRDLTADITEELVEANEAYLALINFYNQNGAMLQPETLHFSLELREELDQLLASYNEEVADVLHFFVELMIYSNLTSEDLTQIALRSEEIPINVEGLNMYLNKGRDKFLENRDLIGLRFQAWDALPRNKYPDRTDIGGRYVSAELLLALESHSYSIIRALNRVRFTLKSKYWKKSDIPLSISNYQTAVLSAWEALFDYLAFMGFEAKQLYSQYELKNIINQNRIIDGY